MNDERFERDLTAVLRDIAGEEAPTSLRYRLRAITDAPTAGRRGWLAPLLPLAAAAVIVIAVAALGWTFLRAPIVGPASTPTPAPTPSVASPSMSPSQSPTPSPSESPSPPPSPSRTATPLPSGWSGLDWSDGVVAFPDKGTRIGPIVAWHGGFVAVGQTGVSETSSGRGAFFTSTDAIHWTVVQEIDRPRLEEWQLTSVAPVGDRLLAIETLNSVDCPAGSSCPTPDWTPDLWTSSDGSHWTPLDSPTWRAAWAGGGPRWIVAGDAGIIAVGYEAQTHEFLYRPPPAAPLVFHSDDGATWEPADLTQGFDQAVFRDAVAYAGGFVIVGRDGEPDVVSEVTEEPPLPLGVGRPAAWVSADGIHWTVAQVDGIKIAGGELSQVVAGADGLFAIGAGSPSEGDATPSGWASPDGRTWHVTGRLGADLPDIDRVPPQNWGNTFLVSDGKHMVVLDRAAPGSDTMAAWDSTDGVTWARLAFTGSTDLPEIGIYDHGDAQGTYVTGATVLPDRVVVAGYGTERLAWLAMAVGP
jgi:hypothetical protein